MDDTEKSLLDYLDILRRRKLYIIVAFLYCLPSAQQSRSYCRLSINLKVLS